MKYFGYIWFSGNNLSRKKGKTEKFHFAYRAFTAVHCYIKVNAFNVRNNAINVATLRI